ncbi:MAG: ABC transporter substrate-binding protein [Spirochaetaceae bacterium]|jgi:NitT/TauT family transport system substrate-binding protein|nr:ABC transporter substrate-binding protein [Spirochaetaceae bacterium]
MKKQSALCGPLLAALVLTSLVLTNLALPSALWARGKPDAPRTETPLALSGQKIIVADANSTHHLNLYVAYEQGLFTKRGLEVEIQQTSAGVAAVVGGEADIVFNCPTGVITPIARGQNITIISQVKIPCTSVLVVPVDTPVRNPGDLRNLQIAGLSNTCCAVIAIRDALRNQYGTEIELVALAPGAALAALEAASVRGAILEEPFVAQALLLTDAQGRPRFKTIFDGHSDANGDGRTDANLAGENPPCRTINANTNFVRDRLGDARAFIEAIEEADGIILANPIAPEIVAIARKYVNVPEQAIINSNPKLGFTIHLDTAGLIGYAQALVNQGTIESNPGEALFSPAFKGITW